MQKSTLENLKENSRYLIPEILSKDNEARRLITEAWELHQKLMDLLFKMRGRKTDEAILRKIPEVISKLERAQRILKSLQRTTSLVRVTHSFGVNAAGKVHEGLSVVGLLPEREREKLRPGAKKTDFTLRVLENPKLTATQLVSKFHPEAKGKKRADLRNKYQAIRNKYGKEIKKRLSL